MPRPRKNYYTTGLNRTITFQQERDEFYRYISRRIKEEARRNKWTDNERDWSIQNSEDHYSELEKQWVTGHLADPEADRDYHADKEAAKDILGALYERFEDDMMEAA